MNLDPTARDSWQGFLDLLRPPPGYRLTAAIGTTYGLTFDALVAALLAMLGVDAAGLARDPAAAVIAVTRLARHVRVLLHPGTIEGRVDGLHSRLVGMLDRILVPVSIVGGLFHPKLWVLRYEPLREEGRRDASDDRVRLVVASRNLTPSRSFEVGVCMDGVASSTPSPIAGDVARMLRGWTTLGQRPSRALRELPAFVREIAFDRPREGKDLCRLWLQGLPETKPLHTRLPERLGSTVVVSPFLQPEFLREVMVRSKRLRVVSTAEAYSSLEPAQLVELEKHGASLFVVEVSDREDDVRIEGIHAKLLIAGEGKDAITLIGSANATGPGWGLRGRNVEAMLELRPGIAVSAFVRSFLLDERKQPRPWVRTFEASDREPPDPEREAEERLLAEVCMAASWDFELRHDRTEKRLEIRMTSGGRPSFPLKATADLALDFVPWARLQHDDAWRPLSVFAKGPAVFDDIDEADVSAFIAVRGRRDGVERVRIAIGTLQYAETDWDRRDETARDDLLARVPPEDLLRALILGLGSLGSQVTREKPSSGSRAWGGVGAVLGAVTLEQVLRSVAADQTLVRDLRLLIGTRGGDDFERFCDDLEAARGEMSS